MNMLNKKLVICKLSNLQHLLLVLYNYLTIIFLVSSFILFRLAVTFALSGTPGAKRPCTSKKGEKKYSTSKYVLVGRYISIYTVHMPT